MTFVYRTRLAISAFVLLISMQARAEAPPPQVFSYLETMSGTKAFATGISADGSIIVGFTDDGSSIIGGTRVIGDKANVHAYAFSDTAWKRQAAEEQRRTLAEEQRQAARINQILKTGKPAQIYALALKMEGQNQPELATKAYHALIDNYPESPYAEKAIDKMESEQKAARQEQQVAQQQQIQQQKAAQQQASNQRRTEQMELQRQASIQRCQNVCSATQTQCKQRADSAGTKAITGGILGALTHGAYGTDALSSTQQAQESDDARASCSSDYDICVASCR